MPNSDIHLNYDIFGNGASKTKCIYQPLLEIGYHKGESTLSVFRSLV